jgi:hypothetical protein
MLSAWRTRSRAYHCGVARDSEQKRDAGFCPPGSDERAENRSDRHDRSQESVLARSCVKNRGRHGRDEYRKVQSERADQKRHGKYGFQVVSFPATTVPDPEQKLAPNR